MNSHHLKKYYRHILGENEKICENLGLNKVNLWLLYAIFMYLSDSSDNWYFFGFGLRAQLQSGQQHCLMSSNHSEWNRAFDAECSLIWFADREQNPGERSTTESSAHFFTKLIWNEFNQNETLCLLTLII